MEEYSFREAVNYPPWIGSDYGESGTRRILMVGRSYYDARYGNHTIQDYLKELIKTDKEDFFFNTAEHILSEKEHWKEASGKSLNSPVSLDRKKFWNSIAFYQYLQGILEESYTRPSRKMWKDARKLYLKVVLALQPEIIAVFSREVFKNLPVMGGDRGPVFTYENEEMPTWNIRVRNQAVSICSIMHPLDGNFHLEVWKTLYNQFMEDHTSRFERVYL